MTASELALPLIKRFEGILDGDPTTVNLDPYLDPVGVWTIGWGHAIWFGSRFLRGARDKRLAKSLYPNGITIAEAETLLAADILETRRDVLAVLKREATPAQLAALISFTFNLGIANLRRSTLLRHFHAGRIGDAADQFPRWVWAGGKVLGGLVKRRAAERALFLGAA